MSEKYKPPSDKLTTPGFTILFAGALFTRKQLEDIRRDYESIRRRCTGLCDFKYSQKLDNLNKGIGPVSKTGAEENFKKGSA